MRLNLTDPRVADGFSETERSEWRNLIVSNVVSTMKQVVNAVKELGIDLKYNHNIVPCLHAKLNWL